MQENFGCIWKYLIVLCSKPSYFTTKNCRMLPYRLKFSCTCYLLNCTYTSWSQKWKEEAQSQINQYSFRIDIHFSLKMNLWRWRVQCQKFTHTNTVGTTSFHHSSQCFCIRICYSLYKNLHFLISLIGNNLIHEKWLSLLVVSSCVWATLNKELKKRMNEKKYNMKVIEMLDGKHKGNKWNLGRK